MTSDLVALLPALEILISCFFIVTLLVALIAAAGGCLRGCFDSPPNDTSGDIERNSAESKPLLAPEDEFPESLPTEQLQVDSGPASNQLDSGIALDFDNSTRVEQVEQSSSKSTPPDIRDDRKKKQKRAKRSAKGDGKRSKHKKRRDHSSGIEKTMTSTDKSEPPLDEFHAKTDRKVIRNEVSRPPPPPPVSQSPSPTSRSPPPVSRPPFLTSRLPDQAKTEQNDILLIGQLNTAVSYPPPYEPPSTADDDSRQTKVETKQNYLEKNISLPEGTDDKLETKTVSATLKQKDRNREGVSNPMRIIEYAEREWRGMTANAEAMLKGYRAIKTEGFNHLRRIRGDNYCAIRASLFQALVENITVVAEWSEKRFYKAVSNLYNKYKWVSEWSFANRRPDPSVDTLQQLEDSVQCLSDRARTVNGKSGCKRVDYIVETFNNEEQSLVHFGLMEAIKFLMLANAIELYNRMQQEQEVPYWVFILFARDTSQNPQMFMRKHLNFVGDTGGLEQVEMFLLGYTLKATIKVLRPSQVGKEDFISKYPDESPGGWSELVLVAEDDRHYNIVTNETLLGSSSCC